MGACNGKPDNGKQDKAPESGVEVATEKQTPKPEPMPESDGPSYKQGLLSITILGATGDLAKKETYPGLLDLWAHDLLPSHVAIVGFGRTAQSTEKFREYLRPWLEKSGKELGEKPKQQIEGFLARCAYFKGSYDSPDDFARLATMLSGLEGVGAKAAAQPSITNRLFYFAIPPFMFLASAKSIKESALSKTGFNRLIVEKPFGSDLASAKQLTSDLADIFPEEQIFRMDHFLGKEVLQNLVTFRAVNSFLEPLLNAEHVANVIVTLKEDFGTEGRGGYFTHYGIIRDVMQNHLLQMLLLLTIDLPDLTGSDVGSQIRANKVKALREMLPMDPKEVVLGQYVGAEGKPGYLEDDSIKPEDAEKAKLTATFAQLVLRFKSARWKGVPFIVRGCKAVNEHKCEIRVQLKVPETAKGQEVARNELVMRIYPKEAIYFKTNVKSPGLTTNIEVSELDLSYTKRYKEVYMPEAYTRLLLAGLEGNPENFVGGEELLASWELFSPLLEKIEGSGMKPLPYPYGSRGPAEADRAAEELGFQHDTAYVWN